MAKSRNGKVATGLTLAAFFFVIISFFTPNWLVTDGKLQNPKFEKIGLWVVCFNGFTDIRHWYETEFCSCWWVFEEEFYIIHDILLPAFFVATQFFFTVCFALLLFSTICILFYLSSSRHNDSFVTLLTIMGSCVSVAAVSGTLSLIIFGYNGDGRVWMPNWEHNDIGYSYALGVIGVICSYIAGGLYLIEARVHKMKQSRSLRGEPGYHMEMRKSAHTPI